MVSLEKRFIRTLFVASVGFSFINFYACTTLVGGRDDFVVNYDRTPAAEPHGIVKSNFSNSDATKQIILEKLTKSLAVQSDEILREKAAELKSMKIRFYMYDDANITLDGSPIIKTLYKPKLQHSNERIR